MADISQIVSNGTTYNIKDATARTTAASAPVASSYLVVEAKSKDNIAQAAGGGQTVSITITKSGYTAIGIVGWNISDASSGGGRSGYIRTYGVYINDQTTANVAIRNRLASGTGDAKVKITVYILYKKN